MKNIYTKTGDRGTTAIRGGERVAKDDPRIEANGQVDHLNSLLGMARAMLPADGEEALTIHDVQRELLVVMSHVATPEGSTNPRQLHVAELTARMEHAIDGMKAPGGFVVAGASMLNAVLHTARTQARTAERRLWTANAIRRIAPEIMVFMNRLSDYLFALAVNSAQTDCPAGQGRQPEAGDIKAHDQHTNPKQ